MKTPAALLLVGFSGFLLISSPEAPAQAKKTAPGWLNSFDAAKTQARQAGKPIFLVFR